MIESLLTNFDPAALNVTPLRDFVKCLPTWQSWVFLTKAYAPGMLSANARNRVCSLFVVPFPGQEEPNETPPEIQKINRRGLFTVPNGGLTTNRTLCYLIEESSNPNTRYPTLWQITNKTFMQMYVNYRDRAWWASPYRRRYERLIVVPEKKGS